MVSKDNFAHYCCVCGALLPYMTFQQYLVKGFGIKQEDGVIHYFCVKHRGMAPVDSGSKFVRAGDL